MEILEIRMNHFGKFEGQNMAFHPGINVIYGENETGKSTMGAFIRAMLYGIERGRGRASRTDEYRLREPWENGAYFSGMMRFRRGQEIFRMERSFARQDKKAFLVCETDGRELDLTRESLEELLGGLDETAFVNTVFVSGQTGATDEGLADEVRNFMINSGGNGQKIDVAGAQEELKEEKRKLEKQKKQKMAEKIGQMQELSMRLDYARQEGEELAREAQKLRLELESLGQTGLEEQEYPEHFEMAEGFGGISAWAAGKIAMAVVAVGALGVALALPAWQARLAAAGVILLACAGVKLFGDREKGRKEEQRERRMQKREEALQREYERKQRALARQRAQEPRRQRLAASLQWTLEAGKEKRELCLELQQEYDRLKQEKGELAHLEEKHAAVCLALDTLTEVTAQIYREHAGKLNKRVSEILKQITGGRYTGVFLDEEFQVRIHTGRQVLSVWQLSRGSMEQVYFALRMACADLMDGDENLPLILDDAFVTYDDARLEQTLRWLNSSGRQVLLFTCHKREQEILQKLYV